MSETEYTVKLTARFKKDYKRAIKRGLEIELLKTVVTILAQGVKLPEKYKDHELRFSGMSHSTEPAPHPLY